MRFFALFMVVVLLAACASSPSSVLDRPAEAGPNGSVVSVAAERREEAERVPEEEDAVFEEEARTPSPESEEVPPWVPPVSSETRPASDLQRAAMRRYLEGRTTGVVVRASDDSARLYLSAVTEELGYGREGDRTLRIAFSIEEIESERNHYAYAVLRLDLDSGADRLEPSSTVELVGRSVFSPISGYDAGMNSLLAIPVEEISSAVAELERSIVEAAVNDGLEYRVVAQRGDTIRAVLDAVSRAGERTGYRFSLSVPQELDRALERILDGSSYRSEVDYEYRVVTITEMGDR